MRRSESVPTALIVDDHEPFRAAARALVELEGYTVIGEAADASSGIRLALELEPDLVLLDVSLPDDSGFQVAERLAASPASPSVVLVSNRDPDYLTRRARECRALGFIPKEQLSPETLRKIVRASDGKAT
jgi:DNA-binding NarL/FixJ family response regulator